MKHFRRFIWFICSRLLIAICILGVMIMAFYYAMNATNIYVILKDGMAKRAQVIMMGEDKTTLYSYFYPNYVDHIDSDIRSGVEGNNYYQYYYNITGFDHRLELQWVWCWPWEDNATATFTERIPAIDGKVKSTRREAALSVGLTASPPAWRTIKYTATLTRENDQWRVLTMKVTEIIEDK